MKTHSLKVTLLPALLLCCLAELLADAAIVHSDGRSRGSTPEALFEDGESSTQTPEVRPGQNQQEAPAGKRKSLHEYGPEDILPEARENQNPRSGNDQSRQPKTLPETPLSSKPAPSPTITPTPAQTPRATPTPTATPAPAESATPAAAMTASEHREPKNPGALRQKLIASFSLFLLLLLALVYFAAKMWRQLRESEKYATDPSLQKPPPVVAGRQSPAPGQAEENKRARRSHKGLRNLKNRMPKAHHT
jgi:hypothetical protein